MFKRSEQEKIREAVAKAVTRTEKRMRKRFAETHKSLYVSYGTALRSRIKQVKSLDRDLLDEQNANARLQTEADTLKIEIDLLTATIAASIKREAMKATNAALAAKQDDYAD